MHFMFFMLVIMAAIAGMVLLFVFWVVVSVLRGITRLIIGPGLRAPSRMLSPSGPLVTRCCSRDSCKALNPVEARFCRRCGQRFEDPHRVAVRRAAAF